MSETIRVTRSGRVKADNGLAPEKLRRSVIPGPQSGTRNSERRRWREVERKLVNLCGLNTGYANEVAADNSRASALWIPGSALRPRNDGPLEAQKLIWISLEGSVG